MTDPDKKDKILKALGDVPDEVVGDHVMESDEALTYALDGPDALAPESRARLDAHLASCEECAESMDHLAEVVHTWTGERLAAFRDRVRAAQPEPSLVASVVAALRRATVDRLRERMETWQRRLPIGLHLMHKVLVGGAGAVRTRGTQGKPRETTLTRGEQEITVRSRGGEIEVRIAGLAADAEAPLVLLVPLGPDAEPRVVEPAREGEIWVARSPDLPRGEYVAIIEPETT